MATQIFVNLPVKDLERSIAFFSRLGYGFDPRYTNANATCVVITEAIQVMLLVESFFQTFTAKELCDTTRCTEAILCLSLGSRAEVDDLMARALAAGATAPNPAQDLGFMYGHGFQDLDGHLWEVIHMVSDPPRP